MFDGAADRYVLDADMADKLRKNNPEAFRNILKRMLEVTHSEVQLGVFYGIITTCAPLPLPLPFMCIA